MINSWINALIKPAETFASEKANASIGKGAINYIIAGLISGILSFILTTVMSSIVTSPFGGLYGAASVISIVTTPIFALIGSLIVIGIFFVVAKILGGSGTYKSLYYLASLYAVPVTILQFVPIIGMLAGLYSIFLLYMAVKESMQMTSGKAIAAVLIPIGIMILLAIILVVIVGAAILSLFTTMPQA